MSDMKKLMSPQYAKWYTATGIQLIIKIRAIAVLLRSLINLAMIKHV
jgi:hypothetical protein